MPREAQRHAVSNGSTTTATSLEEGNLERQIHHSSGELHEVYDRYITVCPYVMQRQDSIDYTNHGSFHLDVPGFRPKSTGTLSGKTPALPHASGNAVESSSLDVLAVFAPKSIDWAFQFSTSTGAVVVDVCCSSSDQNSTKADLNMARIYEAKYQSRFQCPATFKLKENKQGPNLHLTETSHPPLFRNLFMHSRPSNS